MNWEESKALTPLKLEILKVVSERWPGFFLTGGSALGIFYLQHRLSYDLDFFTTDEHVEWHLLDNDIRAMSQAIGATCTPVTTTPSFRRYEITRGDEREILDFVIERVPQIDREKEQFGAVRVDTLREIMINKICTLVGRCEVKDLLDLFFLSKHGLHVKDHIEEARRKEGGLDPAMLSYLLDRVRVDRVPDYVLAPLDLQDFQAFIAKLRQTLAGMAFPERE